MFDTLIQFDHNITSHITAFIPHNFLFDVIFSFFSLHGLTVIIWIILFCLFWYRKYKDKTHQHFFLAFATSFGMTSILVNYVLKNIFIRTRPCIYQVLFAYGCPTNYSFPSAHASVAFSGAVVFGYFDPKRKWLYYGIAGLISISRIYLGYHYVSDVVFGALIGFFIAKATIKILSSRKIL